MFKKIIKIVASLLLILIVIYAVGPRPKLETINLTTNSLDATTTFDVDMHVSNSEAQINGIRPNNQSRIIWLDSIKKTRTPFVLLYLHGFSASYGEGDPVHRMVAKQMGMNLYIPRLHAHGLEEKDAFKNFSIDQYFESAQQALEIAKKLGEKVVIMSCSTGSTLAIMLSKTNPEIFSHIMYSPNIDIKDVTSELVVGPWGRHLTTTFMNGEYNHINYKPEAMKYWYSDYHIDGIIALKGLLNNHMNEQSFSHVKQPLFLGYYYVNDEQQDQVVSIPRMMEFYTQIKTPESKKKKVSFKDATGHVICSSIMNPNYQSVIDTTISFLKIHCK
jgi:esterase/lipase